MANHSYSVGFGSYTNTPSDTQYLPTFTRKYIDRIQRDFLWGATVEKRRVYRFNWNTVTSPNQEGGLGHFHSKSKNFALLCSIFWRLYYSPNSIWSQKQIARFLLHLPCINLCLSLSLSIYHRLSNSFSLEQAHPKAKALKTLPLPFPDHCTKPFEGSTATRIHGWSPSCTYPRPGVSSVTTAIYVDTLDSVEDLVGNKNDGAPTDYPSQSAVPIEKKPLGKKKNMHRLNWTLKRR
uniref:Uncharacterized protein LOC104214006 n=1 Tax=Nicotiana sylvestris TaxID=4096 RepID=A0A1U7VHV7_NICSY|nr:PREDICTED: uncharacterized protein LOC104214006 [Nicotiana sylvestris]